MHLDQFMVYLQELLKWNAFTNLTSITNDEEIVVKHFIDSLAGLSAEPFARAARLLDVGSGAGFPGIPLKIVRPDLQLTLVEPSHKKASFLHFLIGVLRLSGVRVVTNTVERVAIDQSEQRQFQYMVTRALKFDLVLKRAHQLLAPGGKALLYLSGPINRSAIEMRWTIIKEYEFDLPMNGGGRVVSVLQVTN